MHMFRRFGFPFAIPMNAASSDEGGGGGGGGGGGAPGGGDAPKPLDEARVNEILNKALGARDKRLLGDVNKMFTDGIGSLTKTFEEKLSGFKPREEDEPSGGTKGKVDPEVLQLRKQVETLTKKSEMAAQETAAERTKARNEKVRATLTDELTKRVRPELVGRLVKAFASDIQFDNDGEMFLPLADGTTTTVGAAIAAWADTDEGKACRPAPNNGGSGTQQQKPGQRVPVNLNGRKIESLSDEERESLTR